MGFVMKKNDLTGIDNTLREFDTNTGVNISDYFEMPLEEDKNDNYDLLKEKIYKSSLDNEEKALILNKISSLKLAKTSKEKDKIKLEIEKLKKSYNI